jgi:purine-cytosine permease-like protein
VDFAYQPAAPLHGIELWATVAAGVALVASGPLSYNNAADFSRYLPPNTSPLSVAAATTLGSFLPSILFTVLGALAATVVDMSDPQAGLDTILPGWFAPFFLVAVILGTIANNAMTAYSSGLALQAVGLRMPRSRSVMLDGAVGVALTLYALLVSNFLDSVSSMMQLIVALTGPVMAIYAADILWRRNRYNGLELTDETPNSPFWYTAGFNLAGATALIVGATAAFLCLSTPIYTGPIAQAASGVDLSLPVGLIVSAVIYTVMMQSRYARP